MIKDNSTSAQRKLEQEYFKLLEEKHYSKITVSELIEKAGVSRMTFYRHYEDIFDMHKKVCGNIVTSLIEELATEIFMVQEDNLDSYIKEYCITLNSQRKYISLLAGDNADAYLYEVALPLIMEYGNKLEKLGDEQSFALRFVALSGIAIYFYTLVTNKDYSPEYIRLYKKIYDLSQKAEEDNNVPSL